MMKTLGLIGMLSSALALGGCGSAAPPFDPRAIELMQQEQARGIAPREMRALPSTLPAVDNADFEPLSREALRTTTQPAGPRLRLTLQEAVHRAVANSIDVRVAGYQAAIDEQRVLEAAARFDPRLFASYQYLREFSQNNLPFTLTPGAINAGTGEAGIKQALTTGGQIQLSDKVVRNSFDTVNSNTFPSPTTTSQTLWDNQFVLQITQPLLQNQGTQVNLARIFVARNDQRISELDARDKLEKVLQQLEETYWKLARAQSDVRIQEQLLAQTETTLDIVIKRQRSDTSRREVYLVVSFRQQREAELGVARSLVEDLSDQLKRLMGDPDLPIASPTLIEAVDRPSVEPLHYAVADQIETALQNRLELQQQKLRIASADRIIGAARNNMLPKLDLAASLGIEGIDSDLDSAFNSQFKGDFVNYALGIQFEVPIGNREARSIYRRTQLSYQEAIDGYRQIAQQVALDVKMAQRAVETAWTQIIARRMTRFAAENALNSIEQRERAGEALTYSWVQFKLDRQSALADAMRQENEAIASYNTSVSDLEKAKGTLLRYNNVVFKEAARAELAR